MYLHGRIHLQLQEELRYCWPPSARRNVSPAAAIIREDSPSPFIENECFPHILYPGYYTPYLPSNQDPPPVSLSSSNRLLREYNVIL